MSILRKIFAVAALLGLTATANAAYVPATWHDSVGGVAQPITWGETYTYTHDLALDGFNVGSDIVSNFSLSIDLFDDQRGDWWEIALVDLPGSYGDRVVFDFGNNAYQGWSLAGVAELNQFGTLTVSITSLFGDFLFGGSDLVARGYAQTANVPEPATLGLMGMGLLGVAFAARRRKAARN